MALLAWDMSAVRVCLILQGLVIISVLWIVFSAIFLLNTLKYTEQLMLSARVSPTFQLIEESAITAWCFCTFIEGASGFIMPAAIAALACCHRFSALAAVLIVYPKHTRSLARWERLLSLV